MCLYSTLLSLCYGLHLTVSAHHPSSFFSFRCNGSRQRGQKYTSKYQMCRIHTMPACISQLRVANTSLVAQVCQRIWIRLEVARLAGEKLLGASGGITDAIFHHIPAAREILLIIAPSI